VIGESGVNIARFHLGRGQSKERALAVVAIDSPASAELVSKLKATPNITSVHSVDLTGL